MALFGNSKGEKGNVARKTFAWEDAAKGENVMYRFPRNIEWNDNVVVREDEFAIFSEMVKLCIILIVLAVMQ